MQQHQSERTGRIAKAAAYQQALGTAYPSASERTHTVAEFLDQFSELKQATVAGRLRRWREHGKLVFCHLEDNSGRLQLALAKEKLQQPKFEQLSWFDVGDIVQASGTPFTTHKGERSLLVERFTMLTKSLRPLPDEWFGLQDEEQRYRHRYLDLMLRPELHQLFIQKANWWNAVRRFLQQAGFLEVETPVLEVMPGGADAEPFVTHHRALDIDLYLRISMGELWQKRLMIAGFEKTFEIGRQFRNEGISAEHLQDYTQMEFYWAYANYETTMTLVERMYKQVIQETFGKLQFDIHGFSVNFDQTWPRVNFLELIAEQFNFNVLTADLSELRAGCARVYGSCDPSWQRGRLIDMLWKHCRQQLAGPLFVTHHPVVISPLAKRVANQPELVERYQVIVAGSELGNGYTELNDPQDQAQRFTEQAALRQAGDREAQMADVDFVEALEYGLPPTSGFGVSERLFSFLQDKPIRECVMFPLLRPKSIVPDEQTTNQTIASQ